MFASYRVPSPFESVIMVSAGPAWPMPSSLNSGSSRPDHIVRLLKFPLTIPCKYKVTMDFADGSVFNPCSNAIYRQCTDLARKVRRIDKDRGCAIPSIWSRIRRVYRQIILQVCNIFLPSGARVIGNNNHFCIRTSAGTFIKLIPEMYTALHRGMRS